MALLGVTQVLVPDDDHVSVTDFSERAKAQVADAQVTYDQAAGATVREREEGKVLKN